VERKKKEKKNTCVELTVYSFNCGVVAKEKLPNEKELGVVEKEVFPPSSEEAEVEESAFERGGREEANGDCDPANLKKKKVNKYLCICK
jgi:hypothetical protein